MALDPQISIYSALGVFWELPPDKEYLVSGLKFIFAARQGGRLLLLRPRRQDHLEPSRFCAELFSADDSEFACRDDSHKVARV